MDAWTVTDVETVVNAVVALEGLVASLREVAIGLLVLASIWFGYVLGGLLTPSARDMSWDSR